jgi:hypothetical protein
MKIGTMRFFGIITLIVTLVGCSGLPAPSEKSGAIVLIPISLDKSVEGDLFGRYIVKVISITDMPFETEVVLHPYASYQVITGIPEGEYKISQGRFAYEGDQSPGSKTNLSIRFITINGQITIINKEFQYLLFSESGRIYMNFKLIPKLSKEKATEIYAKLKKEKNFSLWKLTDETKGIPVIREVFE